MKKAQLKASLSLDHSKFASGIAKATSLAKTFAKTMTVGLAGKTFGAAGNFAKGFVASLATIAGKVPGVGFAMTTLKGGFTALGGAAGVVAENFYDGTLRAMEFGGAMKTIAERTGISTGRLSMLKSELSDSGVDLDAFSNGIKKMSVNMVDAAKGSGGASTAFEQIGIHANELLALKPDEAFLRIGRAIGKLENPAARAAASVAIFGKSGSDLVNFFRNSESMTRAGGALGRQAQLLDANAAAFERISTRMSHIAGKKGGFFTGLAAGLVPIFDKFTAKLEKFDFSPWGEKLAEATKTGMSWLVVFWNNPGNTLDYFWEYSKTKVLEFGNYMLDAIDGAFPGMGGAIVDAIAKTKAWSEILVGSAISFGEHLSAGVQFAMQSLQTAWKATGIPDFLEKFGGSRATTNTTDSGPVFNPFPGQMGTAVAKGSPGAEAGGGTAAGRFLSQFGAKGDNPGSFAAVLKSIQGAGGGGAGMAARGEAALAAAISASRSGATSMAGLDRTGAIAQAAKAAAMRVKMQPAIDAAHDALGIPNEDLSIANRRREFSNFRAPHSSLAGAGMAGAGWHDLSRGAYGGSDILSHHERMQIQRGGDTVASIEQRHRMGMVRSGDAARMKSLQKEDARKLAHAGTANQLLSAIDEKMEAVAKNTSELTK